MKKETIRVGRATYSLQALSSLTEDEFMKLHKSKSVPSELKGKFKVVKGEKEKGA